MKRAVPLRPVERHVLTDGRRRHAGQRLDLLDQLPVEIRDLVIRIVTRLRERQRHREDILRVETERGVLRIPKALQSQPRAGEEDERECDLRHDERATRALAAGAVAATARARFMQDAAERSEPRDAPGRPDTDDDSAKQRDRHRKGKSERSIRVS